MNGDTLCRHGVSRDWDICEDCILDGNDANAPEPLGILNVVPRQARLGRNPGGQERLSWLATTGVTRVIRGASPKISAPARKANRKRERQARKAGRR